MAKKVPLTKLIKYADRFMGNGTKSCTASDFLARFDRLEDSARDVFRTDQVMQMLNSTKSDDEKAKFVVPCFFQLVEFYTKGVIGADVKGDGNATAVAKATGGSATGGDAKSGDNKTDVRVGGPTLVVVDKRGADRDDESGGGKRPKTGSDGPRAEDVSMSESLARVRRQAAEERRARSNARTESQILNEDDEQRARLEYQKGMERAAVAAALAKATGGGTPSVSQHNGKGYNHA